MRIHPGSIRDRALCPAAACALALAACSGSRAAEPEHSSPAAPTTAPEPAPPTSREPAPPERPQWEVVNLMPAWWRYWEEARDLDTEQQIAAFEQRLVRPHPELFTKGVIGKDPTEPLALEARIADFLEGVRPLLPTMRRLSASIEQDLPEHRASFMEAFPDFEWDGRVYFTISLDAFDGAVRDVGGSPQLLFGLDKIARLHGKKADLAPLFHHELFHIHHLVTQSPFDPEAKNRMYQALWSEGLACATTITSPHRRQLDFPTGLGGV